MKPLYLCLLLVLVSCKVRSDESETASIAKHTLDEEHRFIASPYHGDITLTAVCETSLTINNQKIDAQPNRFLMSFKLVLKNGFFGKSEDLVASIPRNQGICEKLRNLGSDATLSKIDLSKVSGDVIEHLTRVDFELKGMFDFVDIGE